MGDLGSGPSLKMGGGLSGRPLTGKIANFGAKNNKEIFFKNEGLFDLPRSEKRNKELYILKAQVILLVLSSNSQSFQSDMAAIL